MFITFGVLGVIGGVVRRWYFATRLGGSWTGSWLGGGAPAAAMATSGFGAILMASDGLALRGGGG
jgi:hypothetical protein